MTKGIIEMNRPPRVALWAVLVTLTMVVLITTFAGREPDDVAPRAEVQRAARAPIDSRPVEPVSELSDGGPASREPLLDDSTFVSDERPMDLESVPPTFMSSYPKIGELIYVDGTKLSEIAVEELEGQDLGDVCSALRDFAYNFESDLIKARKHLGCDRLTTEQALQRFEWDPESYYIRGVDVDEATGLGTEYFWVLPDDGSEIRRELKNISIDISALPAQQARIPRPDSPYVVRWEIVSHGMLEFGYDAAGGLAAQRGFSWIGAPY